MLVVASLAGYHVRSEKAAAATPEYRLRLFHTHTNQRLDIVYRRGASYVPEALATLDHYLRDHRTGEFRHFDPRLFDLLHDLIASLHDSNSEIHVVCGYRTLWSNEFLRTRSAHTGVARHSLHMLAEAIDIIIGSTAEPSSRIYWADAKSRIMAGIEPSRALRRWPRKRE